MEHTTSFIKDPKHSDSDIYNEPYIIYYIQAQNSRYVLSDTLILSLQKFDFNISFSFDLFFWLYIRQGQF